MQNSIAIASPRPHNSVWGIDVFLVFQKPPFHVNVLDHFKMADILGTSFFDAVDSILRQCAVFEEIQDPGTISRMVNSLHNCTRVLNGVTQSNGGSDSANLGDLLRLITRFQEHWEHKQFNTEVSTLPRPTSEALNRPLLYNGTRGRPLISVNPDQIEFLVSVDRTMEDIAQTLLVSRRALYRRCEEFNICTKRERDIQKYLMTILMALSFVW